MSGGEGEREKLPFLLSYGRWGLSIAKPKAEPICTFSLWCKILTWDIVMYGCMDVCFLCAALLLALLLLTSLE